MADAIGTPKAEAKAKAVILIFNPGAPSHLDLWDPKPEADSLIRGEFSGHRHPDAGRLRLRVDSRAGRPQ